MPLNIVVALTQKRGAELLPGAGATGLTKPIRRFRQDYDTTSLRRLSTYSSERKRRHYDRKQPEYRASFVLRLPGEGRARRLLALLFRGLGAKDTTGLEAIPL